ncbi:MAG: FkbM family methyltransferase, partial [Bosea sp. (in: a-proteobacteria)]
MDLSYAQNMEDMHLARLFEGERDGFYIDVGGGHPVADNVSFRSYLAGWRGIVVEPQDALHRLYAAVRPRDLALDVLVGARVGSADFHAVDKLHGFSTTVEAHAQGAAGFGTTYETQTRAMTTLAALCESHAPARIDWLKIDVEGAEPDVLAGNDWRRFRPRVVLVEAIAPGTMEPSHEAWEPMLLAQSYDL